MIQTWALPEQFVLFTDVGCVVGIGLVVTLTVGRVVVGVLSSLSLVKIALYSLSWNSLAKIAACFSGFMTFSLLSQSQVMLHTPWITDFQKKSNLK